LGEEMPPNGEARDVVLKVFARQLQAVVPAVLDFPGQVRRLWDSYCAAGWEGRTAEVHAARGLFLGNVEAKLRLTEQAIRNAEQLALLAGQPLPETAQLSQCARELQQFMADVFGRWQTQEDLEDMLAASFPLSAEELESIGRKHPTPPEWYSQEGKPF